MHLELHIIKHAYKLILFVRIFTITFTEEIITPTTADQTEKFPNLECLEDQGNGGLCNCDNDCYTYRDCCQHSPYYNKTYENDYHQYISCILVPELISENQNFFMIDRCPQNYKSNTDITSNCEHYKNRTKFVKNSIALFIPVVALRNTVTYRNVYCALCHREMEYTFWDAALYMKSNKTIDIQSEMEDKQHKVEHEWENETEFKQNLMYNPNIAKWIVKMNDKDGIYSLEIKEPDQARKCIPNIVDKCSDAVPELYQLECSPRSYMMLRCGENGIKYKNEHCAKCYNTTNVISCPFFTGLVVMPLNKIFNVQINLAPDEIECVDDATYCVKNLTNTSRISYMHGVLCQVRFFRRSQTKISDEDKTLIIDEMQSNFSRNRYLIQGDYVSVCGQEIPDIRWFNSPTASLITAAGLSVSIFSLLLHLTLFSMVKQMRNFFGKNLASYSFSLLLAYTSLAIGSYATDQSCAVIAVTTYYFFLASFCWMSAMSFDVWQSFWNATKNLKVPKRDDKQTCRFILYSVFSWIVPTLFVFSALLLDNVVENERWDWLKPHFGLTLCWFGNRQALVVFFIIPFSVIILFNAIFFTHTAFMIYSTRANIASSAAPRNDFYVYLRLSSLMGLTWTSAFLALYFQHAGLWIVFIVLNVFQGLIILLTFTFRRLRRTHTTLFTLLFTSHRSERSNLQNTAST